MAEQGFLSITMMDYDSEMSNFRIHMPALTALNFTAQKGLIDTLVQAASGLPVAMSMGTLHKVTYGNEEVLSITPPNDAEAQRELKYLVSYHDATTLRRGSVEIGAANTDRLDPNDRKHAEIGDAGDVDAFIDALEALAQSVEGNAIVVDEITLVGRRV